MRWLEMLKETKAISFSQTGTGNLATMVTWSGNNWFNFKLCFHDYSWKVKKCIFLLIRPLYKNSKILIPNRPKFPYVCTGKMGHQAHINDDYNNTYFSAWVTVTARKIKKKWPPSPLAVFFFQKKLDEDLGYFFHYGLNAWNNE